MKEKNEEDSDENAYSIFKVKFVWIIIGSVLYPRYTPEVQQPNFHIISLVCVIITWVKLLFLPSLFLTCKYSRLLII